MFENFVKESALRSYINDMIEYPFELCGYPKVYTNGLYNIFKYDNETPLHRIACAIDPLFKDTAILIRAVRLSGNMYNSARTSLERTIQYYTDSFNTPEPVRQRAEQYVKVAIFYGTAENVTQSTNELKNNIENLQEHTGISRSLTLHTRHAVSVLSRQDTDKTHTILILTNNNSIEFLIKAILSVFAIIKTLPHATIQKEWDEETQEILNQMYDNAKTDIPKVGELLYKLFVKQTDFKNYEQTKVIRQIQRMAEDIQKNRIRSLEQRASNEQEEIRDYYQALIQKQNNVNSTLAELDYLKNNPQNIDMDWLLKNKSIDEYVVAENGTTRFTLRLFIKTPLNNIDYEQAKRQYARVQNKARFYRNHEKEIKALLVDQTHTLIVRQPVELTFENGTTRVRGYRLNITDERVGVNKGFPYNPHIESFDCWGTAYTKFTQLSRYSDIEQLVMLITACVANLNIGDSVVFEHFCDQFATLRAYKDTPCVIKNETGEIITFKAFLEEIGA